MALSNDYTVASVWRSAIFDFDKEASFPEFTRFEIINRAQALTQSVVADVVAESYMTNLYPVVANAGKYGVSGMSYTAATKILTATLNVAFASTDEGKFVVFREGANIYGATILTYVSGTSVVLFGNDLPAADIAVIDDVLVVATTPSGDVYDVSKARMLRYGTQERIKLFSSLTDKVEKLSDIGFEQFTTTASYNKNKIVWNLSGTSLFLKRGFGLSSYGTLTFRYPRLPFLCSLDTDFVDVLDGNMAQLLIAITRNLIARRIGKFDKERTDDIAFLIQAIYREFNREISLTSDAMKNKITGLV